MSARRSVWVIRRRDGLYLSSAQSVPFAWRERSPAVFRRKTDAYATLRSYWGHAVAQEFGIRVERV